MQSAREATESGPGSSFFRPSIALRTLSFGLPSFAGNSNRDRLDAGVDQVRGNLRTHDAGAEDGDFANDESGRDGHNHSLSVAATRMEPAEVDRSTESARPTGVWLERLGILKTQDIDRAFIVSR